MQASTITLLVETLALSVDTITLLVETLALSVDTIALSVETLALSVDTIALLVETLVLLVETLALLYHVRLISYDSGHLCKNIKNLFPPAPCSLPPCGLNDKPFTEHDISRDIGIVSQWGSFR
ncbi:hypothetical protein [Halotia branconii]|uniref:Uncharacterized protein n=1 Tax=Halotia branconii CENA392 TaxID=1539056 RepID=A0AAJ6P715_9CYAN|nr:hypothetical protein [Halotia branconii]WGV23279.1 hypothetical protein QI031_15740 [Halotia branconii CENA392]